MVGFGLDYACAHIIISASVSIQAVRWLVRAIWCSYNRASTSIGLPLPSRFHFHRPSTSIALPLPSRYHFHPTSILFSSIAYPRSHTHASACMGVAPAESQGQRRCGFDLDGSRKQVVEAHLSHAQGRSQKSGDGGGKILDRKPHLLINAETGSNYYSVRVPANNTYFAKQ